MEITKNVNEWRSQKNRVVSQTFVGLRQPADRILKWSLSIREYSGVSLNFFVL